MILQFIQFHLFLTVKFIAILRFLFILNMEERERELPGGCPPATECQELQPPSEGLSPEESGTEGKTKGV